MAEGDAPAAAALHEAGRLAWPGLELDRDRFAAWIAGRGGTPDTERAADLYLACACAGRSERAAQLFAAEYAADLERAAARVRVPGISAEDARQMLLHRMLVAEEDRAAKIELYDGRGSLRSWVRAVAVRLAIDLHRRGGGREVSAAEALFENLTDSTDPEIEYLKRHYRDEFKQAFEAAVASLPSQARNHLRHAFVDRLTIDQLGALYGVDRSTAARRLTAARAALLAATRAVLIDRLAIGDTELDSIMQLIGSRFDVSIDRIFGE
jgi:RNA polymerase sigma-70 factor, ECF subfamily